MHIDNKWCVTEKDFNVQHNRTQETLFTTGNGYVSVRGTLEEGLQDDPQNESYIRRVDNISLEKVRYGKSKWGTYIPWLMAPHPTLNQQMINLPYFCDIKISADNEPLDMEKSRIRHYLRWLDMKEGILYREIEWETKGKAILKILFSRFPHAVEKHLVINSAKIECLKGKASLKVSGGLNSDVRTNGYDHFISTRSGVQGNAIKMQVETNGADKIYLATEIFSNASSRKIEKTDRKIGIVLSSKISEGETKEFIKLSAIYTSKDNGIGGENAESPIKLVKKLYSSFEKLKKSHQDAWKKKWLDADIEIDGDDKSQQAIRFSIFHLLRGCPAGGPPWAIGSRLASGDLYCGHVFWDNEMYLLPFYIYTNPQVVPNLLRYRHETLNGARNKAKRYGYHGAMYAWQSAFDGEENCVAWQYPDLQIHISADVVFGIWHYFSVTGDDSCLTDFGAEIFFEVARFFVRRTDKREGDSYCSILGVMGPDEYNHFSHNNAYTNRLAKFALEKAAWTAHFLKNNYPSVYKNISKRIKLTEAEIKTFRKIGSSLIIPKDKNRNLILQSEDFEKLAPVDLKKAWKDRSKPFGMTMSQEQRYRNQVLKQADVLMLMHVFPDEFSEEEKRTAFEYYEPKTCHDSSLSLAIHSIIAARIGFADKAYDYWMKSALLDLDGISHQVADGLHESSLGGNWQAIIFGFAGMRPSHSSKKLHFAPHLPKKWKYLRFQIIWHGRKYKIEIKNGEEAIINLV